jgi:hypothetical protein
MAQALLSQLPMPAWETILLFLYEEEALQLPLVARRYYERQDFADVLVETEGFHLDLVTPTLRTKSLCAKAIRNCTGSMNYARRLFNQILAAFGESDRDLTLLMCLHFPPLIPEVLTEAQRTREFLLDLLALCEENLRYPRLTWLGKEDFLQYFPALKSDRDVVMRAVSLYGGNLCSASRELRGDETVVKMSLKAYGGYCCLSRIGSALMQRDGFLEEVAELLEDDMWTLASFLKPGHLDLAKRAVHLAPIYGLRDLPRSLKTDARVWTEAVRQCPMALEYVPGDIVPFEVAKEAIERDPRVFTVLPSPHFRNEVLALLAIHKDGMILAHHRVRSYWKYSKKVVMASVRGNGLALEHACDDLQDDEEVVRAAVGQNGLSLAFASRKRRHQSSIVALAAKQNYHALSFGICCSHVAKRARTEGWTAPGIPEPLPYSVGYC